MAARYYIPFRLPGDPRAGQSVIESGLVIALLSLLVFGVLQVSFLFSAREVMDNAAAAGARARAVGFNEFMVYKVVKASTIPNAGYMTAPTRQSSPGQSQFEVERSRIPLYLGSNNLGELPGILDYSDWDTVRVPAVSQREDGLVNVRTRQEYPLKFPMHRAFYRADDVDLRSSAYNGDYQAIFLE